MVDEDATALPIPPHIESRRVGMPIFFHLGEPSGNIGRATRACGLRRQCNVESRATCLAGCGARGEMGADRRRSGAALRMWQEAIPAIVGSLVLLSRILGESGWVSGIVQTAAGCAHGADHPEADEPW